MTCTVEGFRVWGIGLIQGFQACTPRVAPGFWDPFKGSGPLHGLI